MFNWVHGVCRVVPSCSGAGRAAAVAAAASPLGAADVYVFTQLPPTCPSKCLSLRVSKPNMFKNETREDPPRSCVGCTFTAAAGGWRCYSCAGLDYPAQKSSMFKHIL